MGTALSYTQQTTLDCIRYEIADARKHETFREYFDAVLASGWFCSFDDFQQKHREEFLYTEKVFSFKKSGILLWYDVRPIFPLIKAGYLEIVRRDPRTGLHALRLNESEQ